MNSIKLIIVGSILPRIDSFIIKSRISTSSRLLIRMTDTNTLMNNNSTVMDVTSNSPIQQSKDVTSSSPIQQSIDFTSSSSIQQSKDVTPQPMKLFLLTLGHTYYPGPGESD